MDSKLKEIKKLIDNSSFDLALSKITHLEIEKAYNEESESFFLMKLFKSNSFFFKGDLDKSIETTQEIISNFNFIESFEIKFNTIFQLIDNLLRKGDATKTLEAVGHMEEILSKNESIPKPNYFQGVFYRLKGTAYWSVGDLEKAVNFALKGVELLESEDLLQYTKALNNLALIYRKKGEYSSALGVMERVVPKFNKLGEKTSIGGAYINIGNIKFEMGLYSEAMGSYRKALDIFNELGNKEVQVGILSNLGLINELLGEFQQSLLYYKKALELGTTSDVTANFNLLRNSGRAFYLMSDFDKSLENLFQAKLMLEKTKNSIDLSVVLLDLVRVMRDIKKQDELDSIYKEFSILVENTNESIPKLNFEVAKAIKKSLSPELQELLEAKKILEEVEKSDAGSNDSKSSLFYLINELLVKIFLITNKKEYLREIYENFKSWRRKTENNPLVEANVLMLLGIISGITEEYDSGKENLSKALKFYQKNKIKIKEKKILKEMSILNHSKQLSKNLGLNKKENPDKTEIYSKERMDELISLFKEMQYIKHS